MKALYLPVVEEARVGIVLHPSKIVKGIGIKSSHKH